MDYILSHFSLIFRIIKASHVACTKSAHAKMTMTVINLGDTMLLLFLEHTSLSSAACLQNKSLYFIRGEQKLFVSIKSQEASSCFHANKIFIMFSSAHLLITSIELRNNSNNLFRLCN